EADAVDFGPCGREVGLPVPEGTGLLGSAGREVLRVEVQDIGRAAKLHGRELPAVVQRRRDLRDRIADVQHELSALSAFDSRLKAPRSPFSVAKADERRPLTSPPPPSAASRLAA